VNYRTSVEPSKTLSEPSIPPEVYQYTCHVLRGLVEAYVKSSYGTDSKEALKISYSVDEKFFEPYVKEYYKHLTKVFHPEDIKIISTVLLKTEFVMFEQALKTITSIESKNIYSMCEKITGFDTEDDTLH